MNTFELLNALKNCNDNDKREILNYIGRLQDQLQSFERVVNFASKYKESITEEIDKMKTQK